MVSLLFLPKAAREIIWLEREERARQHYEKHLEERKKKLEEQRLKEERRRAAVEEKRRQRLEEDKVRGRPGDRGRGEAVSETQLSDCEARMHREDVSAAADLWGVRVSREGVVWKSGENRMVFTLVTFKSPFLKSRPVTYVYFIYAEMLRLLPGSVFLEGFTT